MSLSIEPRTSSGANRFAAQTEHVRKTLRDVEIGREIRLLGEDRLAPRSGANRRGKQLEQADAGRIGDQQLVRPRADDRRQLRGDPRRPVDPAVLVPAGDEVLAPLPLRRFASGGRRRLRQRTERIAVEIDDAFGSESLAREGEWVGARRAA